jgi:hypothetical protein
MTAQISEQVGYRGKRHSIAGVNGSGLFDPSEHGIQPVTISTACWRGYHCTYEVAEGSLLLTSVTVGLDEEHRALAERGEGPRLFGKVPRRYPVRGHVYDGLREVMPFTGGLLLADGFIRELYVHMGFHPAWKFREVHELLFERGKVVKEADRSPRDGRVPRDARWPPFGSQRSRGCGRDRAVDRAVLQSQVQVVAPPHR